jgi:hypothetical protein
MSAAPSVQEVLARLSGLGIQLRAEGGNILASPKEAITPDVLDTLRAHKLELLDVLTKPRVLPEALERGIRQMAQAWDYSPGGLAWALRKAGQDPAGWSALVQFDSELGARFQ